MLQAPVLPLEAVRPPPHRQPQPVPRPVMIRLASRRAPLGLSNRLVRPKRSSKRPAATTGPAGFASGAPRNPLRGRGATPRRLRVVSRSVRGGYGSAQLCPLLRRRQAAAPPREAVYIIGKQRSDDGRCSPFPSTERWVFWSPLSMDRRSVSGGLARARGGLRTVRFPFSSPPLSSPRAGGELARPRGCTPCVARGEGGPAMLPGVARSRSFVARRWVTSCLRFFYSPFLSTLRQPVYVLFFDEGASVPTGWTGWSRNCPDGSAGAGPSASRHRRANRPIMRTSQPATRRRPCGHVGITGRFPGAGSSWVSHRGHTHTGPGLDAVDRSASPLVGWEFADGRPRLVNRGAARQ